MTTQRSGQQAARGRSESPGEADDPKPTIIIQTDRALVVGSTEAASRLGCSSERVRELVDGGLLSTVPHLSTPKKLALAVAELERFAAAGVRR